MAVGENTYVCVNIAPIDWNEQGTYLSVSKTLIADELSSIAVQDCESLCSACALCECCLFYQMPFPAWTSKSYQNDTLLQHFNISFRNQTSINYGAGLAISVSSMGVISQQHIYRDIRKVRHAVDD